MLLLANQRAAWAFTFIHFDSLKYYKSTEVLQLLQYCNYYSYCCCSSSAMNQLMLLCISNQVFKCVWCFLCLQFLTFLMSHVINMTFFNQVQSIRILYLCKSITEAAWKYLCKSPDSSQALFSHLSFFILCLIPDPPLPAFVIPLVHLISKSARLPVTICHPSFTHFSSVWGNCPNHESKEAVLISNLSFTCSLNYKGKKSCDLFSTLL